MVVLLTAPGFIFAAMQNYRLYKKAKREGPLVIMPASLPPGEMANLRNSKSVANLEHAVPESSLAKADKPSGEVFVDSNDAASIFIMPHSEAAQQITINNR